MGLSISSSIIDFATGFYGDIALAICLTLMFVIGIFMITDSDWLFSIRYHTLKNPFSYKNIKDMFWINLLLDGVSNEILFLRIFYRKGKKRLYFFNKLPSEFVQEVSKKLPEYIVSHQNTWFYEKEK